MDLYCKEISLEEELDVTCENFMDENPFATIGVMTDDSEGHQRGRPTNDQRRSRYAGIRLRNSIQDRLDDSALTCPRGAHVSSRNKYNRPTNIK